MPQLHVVSEHGSIVGYVAIDSTVAGRARGGLRIVHDLSQAELRDAARSMTLKYGIIGLPQGGAKAGVIGNAEGTAGERAARLAAFARAAAPLLEQRRYIPDADLGTTAEDVREMVRTLGMNVGRREWRGHHSGDHTARSTMAAACELLRRRGRSLAGCRVAVEGFGKVGAPLARMLASRGALVVAISTSRGALYDSAGLDVDRLAAQAATEGSRIVEHGRGQLVRGALLELPVDVLFPCARYHALHSGNVDRVAAGAIVAGANDPISPEAEVSLKRRGVPVVPPFLSNCGGVLGGTLEFAGVEWRRVGDLVEAAVGQLVGDLLERADRTGVELGPLAEEEALARHAAVAAQAESPGVAGRIVAAGLAAYHRGWLPEPVAAYLATRRILRGMA